MPYLRFLILSVSSCFLWVFVLSGAGYFFSGAVMGLIGDFQRLGKVLLVIVVFGIAGFYLLERFWLSKKVEEANPERLQDFEQAAQEKLQDLKQEFQEHLPFKPPRRPEQKKSLATKPGDADGD
jgi:membrane protein DedA with SNARE-associated domain